MVKVMVMVANITTCVVASESLLVQLRLGSTNAGIRSYCCVPESHINMGKLTTCFHFTAEL